MSNRILDRARRRQGSKLRASRSSLGPFGSKLRPVALRAGIAGGVIGAGQLTMPASPGGYGDLRRASFAPPTWAFPVAWTLIELALADSVARLLAAPKSDSRTLALRAAAANDALYVAFPTVFFRLRSPVLTAALTWSQAGAATVQALAAGRIDRRAARDVYPQLAWLGLAGAAAVVQALANPDPALGTRALAPHLGRAPAGSD